MPELQQPDIAGNFLSSYYTAQQQQQAQKDRAFQQQRAMKQDERADQQFEWLKDEQSYKQAMQRKEAIARAAFALDTPEKWAAGVPQVMQSLGIQGPPPSFDQRDRIISEAQTIGDQIDQQWKAKEFELRRRSTEADIRQSNAAARASESLANFRTSGGVGSSGRPMSSGVQSKEDDDIADIQSIQSVNTQIDNVLSNLKSGDLELGPFANLGSRALNFAGASTLGSRNFAEFEATLEKMRNDSLRLNKGVQTEGDAVRAWNEITKYITDPKVVQAQLERVKVLNAQAAQHRLQRINIRRQRNGYGQFNPDEIGYGGGTQAATDAPPDDFSDVDALLGLK